MRTIKLPKDTAIERDLPAEYRAEHIYVTSLNRECHCIVYYPPGSTKGVVKYIHWNGASTEVAAHAALLNETLTK